MDQGENRIPSNAMELFKNYKEIMALQHLYNSAIKEIETRLEILNGEFKVMYARNPIHHVESRLKSSESMVKKLIKRGYEVSIESAKRNLNDIAGVRVVCCYIDDVYSVAEMLLRQTDLHLVKLKDYIKEPNYNGYRSLHLDIEVPIFLSDHTENVTAEVQIRTVAMDFWASLEHELKYKTTTDVSADLAQQLKDCAETIAATDRRMQDIYKTLKQID